MASGTTQNAAPQPAAGRMVAYDRFIEEQLRKTAGGVKSVDIIGGLLTMAAAGVGLLLVAALVDHWVARGGMGTVSRFLFFLVILGAGIYYFIRHVLPSILGRINPAYSAYTIERATPSLKNSLLNFLLLRGEREHVPEAVFNTIEEQAARRLTGVPVESAVDRSRILRIGYVLVALVVLFALYKVLSPKDPFKSAGRVLLPWANITAPSRVTIDNVTPGNHTAMRGEQVAIEATVRGQRDEERVTLTYSSADGQIVNQTIVLARHGETDNYRGKLPESDAGIHAAIEYRVTAGDAASPPYHIDVVAAPTIVVESVDYDYPKYTGLSNRRAVHEGDIRALEGTKVTIHARANQPIKAAWIDFDNDGRTDVKMRPQEDQATASIVLALDEEGRSAKHPRYSLRFANSADQRNLSPVEHSIEVTPDLAPEIVILQPQEEQVELPLDGELLIEVQALDPDFALRRVELRGQVGHREVFERRLLDEPRAGQLVGKYMLVPANEQLKVGDLVEFWAVAEDNRAPKPNRAETDRYRVRIVAPEHPQDPAQRDQRPRQGNNQPGADEPQDPQNDKDQPDPGKSKEKPKKPGDKKSKPSGNDPQQNDPADGDRGNEQSDDQRHDSQDRDADSQQDKQDKSQKEKDKKKPSERNDDQSQSGDEKDSQGNEGAEGDGGSKSGEGKQKAGKQGRGNQSDKSGKSQADDEPSHDGGESGQEGSGGKSGKNASRQGSKHSDRNSESGGEPGEPSEAQDGANERGGEPGQDGGARDNVSKDGSDDGSAFEEALKRLEKQDGDNSGKGQRSGDQSGKENHGADQMPGHDQDAGSKPQKSGQKSGQGTKQPAGQKPNESSDPSGEQKSGASGEKKPQGGKSGDKQPGQKSAEGDQQSSDENSGEPDSQQQLGGDKQGAGKQPAKKPTGQQAGKGGEAKPEGDSSPTKEAKDPDADKPKDAGQKPGGENAEPKAEEGKQESAGEGANNPQPKGKPSQSPQQKPGKDEGSGEEAGGDQGQGAQSKQGRPKQPNGKEPKKSNDQKQQRPEAKGGDGQNDKGEPGAGKEGTDDAGSPDPQTDIQQNNNKQQKPSNESTSKEQTKSPAHGKRESNSDGAQGGDKPGGGDEGGGQQAQQRGTGSPGQNTAADEGNGQSTESGEGDTSDKLGDDVESKTGSGKSQQKPGSGKSQSKPPGGKSGEQPGGKSDDKQSPGQKGTGDKQPTDPNARGGQQGEGGPHAGGDVKDGPRERREAPEPGGDAANLDYARKATDLVLEKLDNQLRKDEVDQELLDRLGWSKDDLAKFVDRWKKMKQEAQGQGDRAARAREELDESLRSLGLGKRRVQRGAGATSDEQNQLREGVRTSAPSEYADQVNAYKKGLSTVKGKPGGKK